MRILLTSLILMIFAFSAQAGGIGTVDTVGAKTLKPGERAVSGSGANLDNTTKKPSRAKVKYVDAIGKDADGNEFTTTDVDVNDPASLDATNVSGSDTFNINNKEAKIDITGDGCTVNLNAKHYDLTVTNDGTDPITVNLPSGGVVTVGTGGTATFKG